MQKLNIGGKVERVIALRGAERWDAMLAGGGATQVAEQVEQIEADALRTIPGEPVPLPGSRPNFVRLFEHLQGQEPAPEPGSA